MARHRVAPDPDGAVSVASSAGVWTSPVPAAGGLVPVAEHGWRTSGGALSLEPWEVHVWTLSLGGAGDAGPADRDVLSPDERERAAGFRYDTDRARFICAHASVRRLLARYTGLPPGSLRFVRNPYGKPELILTPGHTPLRFNLSHSGDVGLVAVSGCAAVGVDCERIREDPSILEVADRFFSDDEIRQLRAMEPGARCGGFYRCWTRKEALIKGIGTGLSFPLDAFAVDIGAAGPQVPLNLRAPFMVPAGWIILDVPLRAGYAGALAVAGGDGRGVEGGGAGVVRSFAVNPDPASMTDHPRG